MPRFPSLLVIAAFLAQAACGAQGPGPSPAQSPPGSGQAAPAAARLETAAGALQTGTDALAQARFELAEASFRRALSDPALTDEALLGLAETQLETGRYDEAVASAARLSEQRANSRANRIAARAHLARGRYAEAQALLESALANPNAYAERVLLGHLLLLKGERAAAELVLMEVIEAYNDDRITAKDGAALSDVGRAAHLLRSPEDANDAYNQAEQVLVGHVPTLLRRARLYLDNYDGAHASEVLGEALEQAPNHPEALALLARLHLVDALNFDEAERLVGLAHAQNPNLELGYSVLASIALHDNGYERAENAIARGLQVNPRSLELTALRGASRFLQDDSAGYQAVKQRALHANPQYSGFFLIVGEFAEWEHRYAEVAELMTEAIAIDDADAKAHAELGLNLIRLGDDAGGLRSLRRAYAKDPLNVRVYNTLRLYEDVLPNRYRDTATSRFRIRYPKDEQAVLERYVPRLLDEAFGVFSERHDFTPETPIGVELYSERPHFAVRTSGLPRTAIQGVCFGKTLAAMTPRNEDFNQSLTLWHELAHVFHIQLSRSRVPRWFTEGLAEYESQLARPEWKRERDQDLFRALRGGRLPRLAAMNEAFTHAEDLLDVTVAYYASYRIVSMLGQRYGMSALTTMLRLWGEGKPTDVVFREALGVTAEQLDEAFEAYLTQTFGRYAGQFLPDERIGAPEAVLETLSKNPRDADALSKRALLAQRDGDLQAAEQTIAAALTASPAHPTALWISGRLALEADNGAKALARAQQLIASNHDGYAVQLLLGQAYAQAGDLAAADRAYGAAHRFDPEEAKPLALMLPQARKSGQDKRLAEILGKLAALDEHDGSSALSLCRLLLKQGDWKGAVDAGQLAILADLENATAHLHYANALAAAGRVDEARFEWQSAAACPGPPRSRADALDRLAENTEDPTRRAEFKRQAEERRRASSEQ